MDHLRLLLHTKAFGCWLFAPWSPTPFLIISPSPFLTTNHFPIGRSNLHMEAQAGQLGEKRAKPREAWRLNALRRDLKGKCNQSSFAIGMPPGALPSPAAPHNPGSRGPERAISGCHSTTGTPSRWVFFYSAPTQAGSQAAALQGISLPLSQSPPGYHNSYWKGVKVLDIRDLNCLQQPAR